MKINNFREALIVKLIKVATKEGSGTEEDPSRLVYWYLDFNGNVLFKKDPVGTTVVDESNL